MIKTSVILTIVCMAETRANTLETKQLLERTDIQIFLLIAQITLYTWKTIRMLDHVARELLKSGWRQQKC